MTTEDTIRWDCFDSPLGPIYAAFSPRGLCRFTRHVSGQDEFAQDLAARFPGRPIVKDAASSAETRRQSAEYFERGRRAFDVPLDLSVLSDFERDVLEAALAVPYGQTVTYSDLARRIGRPKAARAVGNALRRNPIAIIIPCHRIIRADGSPGGYAGPEGTAEKSWFLRHESDNG
jgi:methylated-DNA-[protein]-cysteine S-methyltransferase